MDDVLESVHGDDFAFTAFVGAACDQDLIIFADGDGTDLPMMAQLVGLETVEEGGGEILAGTYIVFVS